MEKKKYLFATDFGLAAKVARRTLSKWQQTEVVDVHLLHVICSYWQAWLGGGLREKEATQRLEIWQQKITRQVANNNQLHIAKGAAPEAILNTADAINADLIVLGAGNYAVGSGTVAKKVVRSAKQSVLLCKHENIQQVLCGVDGSPPSAKALEYAINLCRRLSAKLCIISILPRAGFNPMGLTDNEIKQEEEKFKAEKMLKTKEFLQKFDVSGLEVEELYPWGVPSRVILDSAEDFDYDMIIIGAKGENKFKSAVIGSTAEKILYHTPCSLLVIR